MGFAYGHLSSKAVAVAVHTGRGLAAQQILEEFSSQKGLNSNVSHGGDEGASHHPHLHVEQCFSDPICPIQVRNWIGEGVHLAAGDEVFISWGKRILNTPGILFLDSQTLILRLLADYHDDGAKLLSIVDGMGGVWELFLRFFQHYHVSAVHAINPLPRISCDIRI